VHKYQSPALADEFQKGSHRLRTISQISNAHRYRSHHGDAFNLTFTHVLKSLPPSLNDSRNSKAKTYNNCERKELEEIEGHAGDEVSGFGAYFDSSLCHNARNRFGRGTTADANAGAEQWRAVVVIEDCPVLKMREWVECAC
jgi:hypothetical protein